MDEPEVQSGRARRALPLMAGALAAIVVAGLVYLHPASPSSKMSVARTVPSPPVISGLYTATFDFVTPSSGWALVVDNLSGPQHVYQFRTTDGGKHWRKQFTGSTSQVGITSGIQFFDSNRGLIQFGFPAQVYRTSDAGNHWALVAVPPYQVSSVAFTDPSHGWVLAQDQSTEHNSQPGAHFFATTNGGSSWTELPWPKWAVFWGGKGVIGGDLQFRRPNDGWLGAVTADRPTIYSTADGGATWQPHFLPNVPAPDLARGGKPIPPGWVSTAYSTHVTLLPGSGVIAFIDYDIRSGAFTSFDGGKTWRALALPPPETGYSDFVFQDSTHWWAMRFGTLWKSSDAGQSWRHVSQLLDDFDYRPHVIDAKHAWAELRSSTGSRNPGTGLGMSSDAGLHWTYANVPKPD